MKFPLMTELKEIQLSYTSEGRMPPLALKMLLPNGVLITVEVADEQYKEAVLHCWQKAILERAEREQSEQIQRPEENSPVFLREDRNTDYKSFSVTEPEDEEWPGLYPALSETELPGQDALEDDGVPS